MRARSGRRAALGDGAGCQGDHSCAVGGTVAVGVRLGDRARHVEAEHRSRRDPARPGVVEISAVEGGVGDRHEHLAVRQRRLGDVGEAAAESGRRIDDDGSHGLLLLVPGP
jgi:hypothetical protein